MKPLKVGDRVYAVDDLDNGKFKVETAIIEKITDKRIYLIDGDDRNCNYPGLAFGCKQVWDKSTVFALTPKQACEAELARLLDRIVDLEKQIKEEKILVKELLIFKDKLK